jgi:hypothetical protein
MARRKTLNTNQTLYLFLIIHWKNQTINNFREHLKKTKKQQKNYKSVNYNDKSKNI